jgi:BASS family bile acid:Na+ symporter
VSAPPVWFPFLAAAAIFAVMLSLGLLLGRAQIAAAIERRVALAAILFAVVVPTPALAVLFVKLLGLRGPVAAGIVLMAISPGAPVALRRAIDLGDRAHVAPALHLAIVLFAVVTVPASVAVMDTIFGASFSVTPLAVGRQVLFAQLLPLAVGAVFRALRPAAAARLEPRLAGLSNLLLIALVAACLYIFWPLLVELGWMPLVGGAFLTACALAVGGAFAGRDAAARPQAAIASAMRNPGLAIFIASANRAPAAVAAAVFGYALGAAVVVTAYVAWQERVRGSTVDRASPGRRS